MHFYYVQAELRADVNDTDQAPFTRMQVQQSVQVLPCINMRAKGGSGTKAHSTVLHDTCNVA